jgi:hypothetical protein
MLKGKAGVDRSLYLIFFFFPPLVTLAKKRLLKSGDWGTPGHSRKLLKAKSPLFSRS